MSAPGAAWPYGPYSGPPKPPGHDTAGPGPGTVPNAPIIMQTPIPQAAMATPPGLTRPAITPPYIAGQPITEYTQNYVVGPDMDSVAPLGLQPVGPDLPGTYPVGIQPEGGLTAQSMEPLAGAQQSNATTQYVQRYAQGYVPGVLPYQAGLRGDARTLPHFPDYLTQPTWGPQLETNKGYPFSWRRTVVKSFAPTKEFQSIFVNGKAVPAKRFKARALNEINANPFR